MPNSGTFPQCWEGNIRPLWMKVTILSGVGSTESKPFWGLQRTRWSRQGNMERRDWQPWRPSVQRKQPMFSTGFFVATGFAL